MGGGLVFGLVKPAAVPPQRFATALINNGTISGSVKFSQPVAGGATTVAVSFTGIPVSSACGGSRGASESARLHANITTLNPNTSPILAAGYSNATPTTHGFHIHVNGDLGNNCGNAGAHFNVLTVNHGAPSNAATLRHTGDLGNHVTDASGAISETFSDSLISLDPAAPSYIIGRAFMIHADRDDYGTGGYADSLTTGHAGARLACGVIVAS